MVPRMQWYSGTGGVALSTTPVNPQWPTLPWRNGTANGPGSPSDGTDKEGCSISYQVSRRETPVSAERWGAAISANYSAFRLFDVNGDGSSSSYRPPITGSASTIRRQTPWCFTPRATAGAPTCPAVPLKCERSSGMPPTQCTSDHAPVTFAPIGPGGAPSCPSNAGCRSLRVAVKNKTQRQAKIPYDAGDWDLACPCFPSNCEEPNYSLESSVYARRGQGADGTRFPGPQYEPGDVGARRSLASRSGTTSIAGMFLSIAPMRAATRVRTCGGSMNLSRPRQQSRSRARRSCTLLYRSRVRGQRPRSAGCRRPRFTRLSISMATRRRRRLAVARAWGFGMAGRAPGLAWGLSWRLSDPHRRRAVDLADADRDASSRGART